MFPGRNVCPVLPGLQRRVWSPNVCTCWAVAVGWGSLEWASLTLAEAGSSISRLCWVPRVVGKTLCSSCATFIAVIAQTHGQGRVVFEALWGVTDKYFWNDCGEKPSWGGYWDCRTVPSHRCVCSYLSAPELGWTGGSSWFSQWSWPSLDLTTLPDGWLGGDWDGDCWMNVWESSYDFPQDWTPGWCFL